MPSKNPFHWARPFQPMNGVDRFYVRCFIRVALNSVPNTSPLGAITGHFIFKSLQEVKASANQGIKHYNCVRAHEALGNVSPEKIKKRNELYSSSGVNREIWGVYICLLCV